jgi:serine/threonine protein kinase
LNALAFAHRNGIVHRDIKRNTSSAATDGSRSPTSASHGRASQMTEVGSIVGRRGTSPERARGAPVDPRSDLYSLGVMMYEMLTGAVTFTGDTPVEIAMKHLSQVPTPPSECGRTARTTSTRWSRALCRDRPAVRLGRGDGRRLARVARGVAVSRGPRTR